MYVVCSLRSACRLPVEPDLLQRHLAKRTRWILLMSIGGGGTRVGPLIDALDVKFMAALGQHADGISRIVLLKANDAGIV